MPFWETSEKDYNEDGPAVLVYIIVTSHKHVLTLLCPNPRKENAACNLFIADMFVLFTFCVNLFISQQVSSSLKLLHCCCYNCHCGRP